MQEGDDCLCRGYMEWTRPLRNRSLIMGRRGVYKTGGGSKSSFTPTKKGGEWEGGGGCFSHAEGGGGVHNKFCSNTGI